MTDNLAMEYAKYETAKKIMKALKQSFSGIDVTQMLMSKHFISKMFEGMFKGTLVKDHVNQMNILVEEFMICDYKISEDFQVMNFLNSLPPFWENFAVSFSH